MTQKRTLALRLDRVALADIHNPAGLARALRRQIGPLAQAVPVVDIAEGLDIVEVRQQPLDGCEGVLLTQPRRHSRQHQPR